VNFNITTSTTTQENDMAYNFNKKATVGKWEVSVDEKAMYGCTENVNSGNGGGLWFEKQEGSDELSLRDYDGLYELPTDVVKALRQMDINVSEDFE
jgi:hypothetical protein